MNPEDDAVPLARPRVLAEMRIEREATSDGRTVLYFSWPPRAPRPPKPEADE